MRLGGRDIKKSVVAFGIDQGLRNLGYSVARVTDETEPQILTSGVLETFVTEETALRIKRIYDFLYDIIKQHPQIEIIGTENLFVNSSIGGKLSKSSSILETNLVTGVIYLLASQNNKLIRQYTPGTVKKYVTGDSKASKESVAENLKRICDESKVVITADHQSDAIGIAVTAAMELYCSGVEAIQILQKKIKKKPKIEVKEKNAFTIIGYNSSYDNTLKKLEKTKDMKNKICDLCSDTNRFEAMERLVTKEVVGKRAIYIIDSDNIFTGFSSKKKNVTQSSIQYEKGEWIIGKFKTKICDASIKGVIKKVREEALKLGFESDCKQVIYIPRYDGSPERGKYEIWCKL